MARPLIIGNWKIYPTLSDALVLASSLRRRLETMKGAEVVLAPPQAYLVSVVESWGHALPHVKFAAQNVWPEDQGAYTGETSAYMVKDVAKYALVGHSERRRYAGEEDDLIREKIQACLRWQLHPVLCVGESKRVMDATGRFDAHQWQKLSEQLMEALHGVKDDFIHRLIIAYEPVWAISQGGVGNPAKPEYAQVVIARLRERLAEKYGKERSREVRFLYGGSVTSDDAADFLRSPDVDGLLVGAASVKAKEFLEICELAAGQ
jgi:triosephosphate isomerase